MTPGFAAKRLLVFDLDGTLYLGDRPIPGGADFVRAAEAGERSVAFVTNNSSRSPGSYEAKLARLGIPVRPGRVYTSGTLTAQLLAAREPRPRVLLLGTPDLAGQMAEAGLALLAPGEIGDRPDVVVLGFDQTLTYDRLRAADHWLRAGVEYVATHPDRVCPIPGGSIPDTGSMIELLAASAGRRPDLVVGKPSPAMLDLVLDAEGATRADTAMIGDRLSTDIAMARAAGVFSVLVLTGEATRADAEAAPADQRPDLVVESVAELTDRLS